MKNFLSAIYDSMLIFVLLFIVVASFIATFALSPIPYRESLLAKNETNPILGESDEPVLRFEDKYKEHDFFKVDSIKDTRSFSGTILIGPMTAGEVDRELVSVHNDSKITREAVVNLKASEASTKNVEIKLLSNDSSINANTEQTISIMPEDSQDLKFYLKTDQRINFPIEVSVTIILK